MKKQSLRSRIEAFFKKQPDAWISGGFIEELAMKCVRENGSHYKASNASRRLREMESGRLSEGKKCPKVLDARTNEKGHVEYKWHKTEKIISSYEVVDGVAREVKQMTLV